MGELPHESWRRMLDVNLGGAVNAVAAVAPAMVERGRGTIVTTTSWLSLAGGDRGDAYYAASIGAVIAFTKSFSVEVAKYGVRVNCVAIGPTEGTEGLGALRPEELPAGRLATPEDVAETVLFLADQGDFYVGQVFQPTAGAVM
jgi:NAD(P)-dependent dehydrogenase (short-subunit alcohol dehydrogenase family)